MNYEVGRSIVELMLVLCSLLDGWFVALTDFAAQLFALSVHFFRIVLAQTVDRDLQMSDHFHLLARDTNGTLAQLMGYMQANIV